MNEPSSGWSSPAGNSAEPAAAGWQPGTGWGPPRPAEPKPGVVPLRPLGLGELLDGAVGLIRRYPRPVLGVSAGLSILATILNVTLAVTAFRPLIAFDTQLFTSGGSTRLHQLDGAVGGAALGTLGSSAIGAITSLLLTGMLTVIAGRGVLGQPMSLGQAWTQVRPALGRLLAIALLTALLVYGSLLAGLTLAVVLIGTLGTAAALIGVPVGLAGACLGAYLYCRLALAPCASVLERAGVRTSMRRSGLLVRRSWWRVFGVLLLALVVSYAVSQVLQLPFVISAFLSGRPRGSDTAAFSTRLLILSYIGRGIAQTVVAPFSAGVRALLYVDRRMRAEGLDVALNAAAASRPA